MDLKRLRYFICVSELGSFTLAARHLGVAQPALSRHIRQLEAECGSALLRRNGRGAELTEVGRTMLEHGRSLLEQVGRLEAGLKAAKGAPTGGVTVGMPPSVCMILIEPLFHRVRREFPGIRLHISDAFSGDVREWLVGGRLDIGVLDNPARSANLIGQHLLVEDLFLCRAPSALDAAAPRVSLADAIRMPRSCRAGPTACAFSSTRFAPKRGWRPMWCSNSIPCLDQDAGPGRGRRNDPAVLRRLPGGRERDDCRAPDRLPLADAHLVVGETVRRPKTPATMAVVKCLREEVERLVAAGLWTGPNSNQNAITDRPI